MNKLHVTLATLGVAALLAGCERPPMETRQVGYRGTGMELVYNPRTVAELYAKNQPPAALPPAPEDTLLAKDVYQNVQVLNDLTVQEFTRVMLSITAWVAPPDKSCLYCHVEGEALSADTLYTKKVARQMLAMTRYINTSWQPHVAQTGVTCYTCHRGKPVPQYTWFTDPGTKTAKGLSATTAGQNSPSAAVELSSLPRDPFTPFLLGKESIRVQSNDALPVANRASIKQTEWTYALMVHMSKAMGVNCDYCHNSRAWNNWAESSPKRVVAWQGINMVRTLNNEHIVPLTGLFPANRKGPLGDVAKVYCMTCHQGVYKPLFGAPMSKDYPELRGRVREVPATPAAPADGAAPAATPTAAATTAALLPSSAAKPN
jgi:photosynthetic reaction center cytochrome c subunit